MNLASKKQEYDTCSNMKEKPLELQRFFVPHLRGLNLISSGGPTIIAV